MAITLILHTENEEKLISKLKNIEVHFDKANLCLRMYCKNYIPWSNPEIKDRIINYGEYLAIPTNKDAVTSTIESVLSSRTQEVLIVDENDTRVGNFRLLKRNDILNLNLDSKYLTLKWFLIDILTQINQIDDSIEYDDSSDCKRFLEKVKSPFFKKRIIYIDGGLGDHVMSLPLLEKIADTSYICCKYKFVFKHLESLGFIDWSDELFGGYKRYVYEFGSNNNSKTIIDAFFEMYNVERTNLDILKYTGPKIKNEEYSLIQKIAIICTSAAKISGDDSNKDWSDIKWFKLVNKLKSVGYYVIQVGSINDNQIPNVDSKFLDKPIENLASLIEDSSIWISVDTFFHHFASAISPTKGICLTPYYNDHAKHKGVYYIEKDCGIDFSGRRWWLDSQQPERKKCMSLISVDDVYSVVENVRRKNESQSSNDTFVEFIIPTFNRINELRVILSSLICQTDDDWSAHVVIDDKDNQEIINLVNSFKSDKIYYSNLDKNYKDYGHTPRNYGKNMSNAKYLIMTGDDNYYVPVFVAELKNAGKENPAVIYYDMIHSHPHYHTRQSYQYWKSLLILNGIDIGSFAIRQDIAKKYDLINNHSADGFLIEEILKGICDNYIQYRESVNNTHSESVELKGIKRIDKVLYVHN
jgi:hypothetical protein